jgi:hypothetical protein
MDDRGDYIKKKVTRLEDIPDEVMKRIVALQNKLSSDLIEYYMGQMDLQGGNIVFNAHNQQVLGQMVEALKREFEFSGNSDYDKIIENFAREINNQAKITLQLLKTDFDELPTTYNQYFNFIKTEALKNFEMGNIEGTLIEPIRQTLSSSMAQGAKFNDTVSALRVLMKGGEFDGRQVDGKLYNYMKTYTRTSFAEVDRGFTTYIATEIGVQWYYYDGGTVKDSREFCVSRHGKYWHIKEIEGWAKLNWDGKRQGTNSKNILSYLGGWNCMHTLIPVSEFAVPQKDQLRAQAKGFWKVKELNN